MDVSFSPLLVPVFIFSTLSAFLVLGCNPLARTRYCAFQKLSSGRLLLLPVFGLYSFLSFPVATVYYLSTVCYLKLPQGEKVKSLNRAYWDNKTLTASGQSTPKEVVGHFSRTTGEGGKGRDWECVGCFGGENLWGCGGRVVRGSPRTSP